MPLARRHVILDGDSEFVIIGCSERKGCDLCFINEPPELYNANDFGPNRDFKFQEEAYKNGLIKNIIAKTIQQI